MIVFHVLKQMGCIFGANKEKRNEQRRDLGKKRRGDGNRPELDVFTTE